VLCGLRPETENLATIFTVSAKAHTSDTWRAFGRFTFREHDDE